MGFPNNKSPHRPRMPWWPMALLILAQFSSGLRDMPQHAFFLIYLQEQLELAPATISGIVAGAQAAGMIVALLGGVVSARLGSAGVLVLGLALSGLSSLAFQFPSTGLAAASWLAGGAGMALTAVGSASFLTRLSGRRALGVLAALYALSMTIGGAIGNPLAGALIEQHGFGAFGWAAMAVSGVAILIVAVLMAPLAPRGEAPATGRILALGALPALRIPRARLLIGLRCLPTVFYGTLSVLIPLLLHERSGSKALVAGYGTAMLIVASAAQLLAGRAADRWGARRPTLTAYAVLVFAGLGLAVSAGAAWGWVWGVFVFGVLGNAAAWSLSTLMYVWVTDGIPRAEHPAMFGLLHAVWSLSMVTGSMLGGWLVMAAPGLPFLLGGLLNAGAMLLAVAYYRAVGTTTGASRASE
jgi:MFS family permease